LSAIATGVVALYVDQTTGNLKLYGTGSPGLKFFFWVQASGPMDNV
jgi:hypothetical protein